MLEAQKDHRGDSHQGKHPDVVGDFDALSDAHHDREEHHPKKEDAVENHEDPNGVSTFAHGMFSPFPLALIFYI